MLGTICKNGQTPMLHIHVHTPSAHDIQYVTHVCVPLRLGNNPGSGDSHMKGPGAHHLTRV